MSFSITTKIIDLPTRGESEIIDITREVEVVVDQSKVKEGQVFIFSPGSTVGLTTVEYEPGLIKDLDDLFEKIAPRHNHYHHEDTWHDGNGYAHVRASLFKQTLHFPIHKGKILRGTWQQMVFIDFDNKPRQRKISVQVMGL